MVTTKAKVISTKVTPRLSFHSHFMFPTKGNFWLNTQSLRLPEVHKDASERQSGDCEDQDRPRARLLARARIGNMHYYGTLAPAEQPRRPGGLMSDLESVFRVCEASREQGAWWTLHWPGNRDNDTEAQGVQTPPSSSSQIRWVSISIPHPAIVECFQYLCNDCADSTNSRHTMFPEF